MHGPFFLLLCPSLLFSANILTKLPHSPTDILLVVSFYFFVYKLHYHNNIAIIIPSYGQVHKIQAIIRHIVFYIMAVTSTSIQNFALNMSKMQKHHRGNI